jgi:hypothetical protein
MDTTQGRDARRAIRIAAATAALAATIVTSGAVAAQTASPTPDTQAQAAPAVPGDQQGLGGHNGGGRGQMGGGHGLGQDFGGDQMDGRGGVPGMGRGAVTVTSNDGTSLGLETSDGWSRTIDTTGVVLTENGTTIGIADIAVGDTVGIAQTRNADGSYTVTGIAVLPATVSGTVATVATDSFTLTLADGTTQTVNVSATTTWRVQGSTAPGIADLTAGRQVSAAGTLATDGSLDATTVVAR